VERNLWLYPRYRGLRDAIFWLPVFFLYFRSVLPADRVLLLEAVYYLGVVVLEVPSGWWSDRIGRRPTLLISSMAWVLACCLFAAAPSIGAFLAAQLLLALGMAFASGTDSAFLFDSLRALGRESEVLRHEARAVTWSLAGMGIAAVGGGLLGMVDLRLGHAASALTASGGFAIAWHFREPPRQIRPGLGAARQLLVLVKRPALLWLTLASVTATVVNHVPYELFQPYLELLLGDERGVGGTPVAAGLTVGAALLASAWASRQAERLADRLGPAGTLLFALSLQGALMAAMAIAVHPVVGILLGLRSVSGAIFGPVLASMVHPLVDSSVRATWLSVMSLVGRLGFAGWLAVAATSLGADGGLDHGTMQVLLVATLVGLGLAIGVLLATRGATKVGAAEP
jgi:MFS family permease